ncbi:MAG: class I SAM-dependent methyltransferase [Pseudomonadota bacterium]
MSARDIDPLTKPDEHLNPEVAANYDAGVADRATDAVLEPTLDVLAGFAGDAGALEFAIGTGRVALPLAARGVDVEGVDFSAAMLAEFARKAGAERLRVIEGDMTTTDMGRRYGLVYLVFNTIMNLRDQDAQVAAFVNAARHLEPGGRFVVEVIVPSLHALPPGERFRPFDVSDKHLGFDEYLDRARQILVSHHWYRAADDRLRQISGAFRYVWPAELDLMARIAGMTFESRWADWDRSPFTDDSPSHVSVWRLATSNNSASSA